MNYRKVGHRTYTSRDESYIRPSHLYLAAGILAPSFIPFRIQTLSEDIGLLVQVAKRI